jgi:hypothetical protein
LKASAIGAGTNGRRGQPRFSERLDAADTVMLFSEKAGTLHCSPNGAQIPISSGITSKPGIIVQDEDEYLELSPAQDGSLTLLRHAWSA